MIFFRNTNLAIQRNLTNILGFEWKKIPTKYLRVPLKDKVYKLSTWEGIINSLQERVKNWMYRYLNLADKLILTNIVLQAIPTFMMLVFPTPQGSYRKSKPLRGTSYGEVQKQRKNGPWWPRTKSESQKEKEAWGYKIQK
jgi:hypothetical protein